MLRALHVIVRQPSLQVLDVFTHMCHNSSHYDADTCSLRPSMGTPFGYTTLVTQMSLFELYPVLGFDIITYSHFKRLNCETAQRELYRLQLVKRATETKRAEMLDAGKSQRESPELHVLQRALVGNILVGWSSWP